ncbi:hypothetical protein RRG08_027070 [Elysia crispata]|uniref:Uncharacterized protein n=1 Tax=Elysia crispata TaxID=231223 RepID=A0AAE1DGB2_9GAST|nr:hypothetical protein RRG08_027070 [Elysia crispata]
MVWYNLLSQAQQGWCYLQPGCDERRSLVKTDGDSTWRQRDPPPPGTLAACKEMGQFDTNGMIFQKQNFILKISTIPHDLPNSIRDSRLLYRPVYTCTRVAHFVSLSSRQS